MRTGFDAVNAAIKQTDRKRHGPSGTTRIYTLFPKGLGGFSVQTADYRGDAMMVAATSVRQAYALAHKDVWINPEHEHPVGIVSTL